MKSKKMLNAESTKEAAEATETAEVRDNEPATKGLVP